MFLIYEPICCIAALTHAMAALGRAGFEPVVGSLPALAPGFNAEFQQPSATAISLLLLGCELMLLLSGFLPLWFSLARQAAEAPTAASIPSC